MNRGPEANPVVHLELRTGDLPRACAFLAELLGWDVETVHVGGGSYVTLDDGGALEGGVIEENWAFACWLPYVKVSDVAEATAHARTLGASVVLAPREGPAGWRSTVLHPAGGHLAFWKPKR